MDLKAPSAKHRKVSTDHCIICFKTLNPKKEPVVMNPTSEGLNAILKTSELKKEDIIRSTLAFATRLIKLDSKSGVP